MEYKRCVHDLPFDGRGNDLDRFAKIFFEDRHLYSVLELAP